MKFNEDENYVIKVFLDVVVGLQIVFCLVIIEISKKWSDVIEYSVKLKFFLFSYQND